MHVLLVSTGSAGNMLPFIGLGAALRARGHVVTLIASGAGTETACQAGLEVIDLDDPQARPKLPTTDAATVRKPGFLRTLGSHAVRHMRRVFQLIADRQAAGKTVIVAPGWLFGARIAQEKLGMPLATVYLQPLLFGSVYDTPGLPGWVPRWIPRLVNALVEHSVDRGLAPAIDAFRAELGLPPVHRPVLRWWRSPELVIGFFPAWYSAPQPDWPAQTLLGGFPLYDAPATIVSPELEEFLSDGEPPLVFSQAWMIQDAREYFAASVEAAQRLGRRAVLLTAHRQQLPRSLPRSIRHFGFVPLSALLPRAAALVHHGGIGTIGQALAAAVPQLTVPMILDQFDNSRRLYRLGVSANVRAAAYRPATVARLLRGLLESPAVAKRCRRYAALSREDKPFEKACLALEQLNGRRTDKTCASDGNNVSERGGIGHACTAGLNGERG
ncbi:MAG TPA: glycosyltransferase [Gemmataceae bacterium]|nr:glycosyltransferase [Gemmataceae bacterium]